MSSDLKEEYLNKKYAEYDDESDLAYKKRKHIHKPIKKSNHKHMYENVVVVNPEKPDSFSLVGRCAVCGKVGNVRRDKRLDKKFPHVSYTNYLLGITSRYDNEYEDFKKWCKQHYTVYEIENFDLWDCKYI